MDATADTLYVDTPAALERLCVQIDGQPWLALDTEFLREKTYFPQLCLVQIATPQLTACVDPLALADLGPLLDVLYRPTILKVLHASRQDLEIFHHLRGAPFAPVFDTQLAAPLLGHPDQVGYAALVAAVLGVNLSKSHTRADWRRRPLPPEQLRYAADDVRYLAPLYQRLNTDLAGRGRLDWLADEFTALSDPGQYENPPEQAWHRVRGADRLRGPRLAVLQDLAAWRESTARAEDQPRAWLLRDETLLDLARMMPQTEQDLRHLRGLNERVAQRHGADLVMRIRAAAQQVPRPAETARPHPPRLEPSAEALADLLMAVVRARAQQHQLSPATLAPRKEVERLVAGEDHSVLLKGWRERMIGEELRSVLRGERHVSVVDGELLVSPAGP
ncbi:MAG: ribonuclease D [Chromatiales bacterium 21-64-14]|nr:MAG: ribonuclease D [Chromatiales bacterium 21-64-14]HQU14604.1 ribonuclease D [Gammaproteobacteria bacterium]